MYFSNAMSVPSINVPLYLRSKIFIGSTCNLTETETKIYNIALQEVYEQLFFVDQINLESVSPVNILFTKNGSVNINFNDLDFSICFSLIVHSMSKIREMDDEIFTLFTFVEELTHYFWKIQDETKVKYKVEEIVKRYKKDFSLSYARRWKIIGLE